MSRLGAVCALALVCACGSDDSDGDTGDEQQQGDGDGDGDGAGDGDGGDAGDDAPLGFFVSSDKSETGDLGGLAGADARCQALAAEVGAGDRTWRAYLSAEDSYDGPVNARDRIGEGPWYNAAGELLARDLDELHALTGDADLFLDEKGNKINGQWEGSPDDNEHDILTGTDADGNVLAGKTCEDWTSASDDLAAQVGHSDGLGPGMNADPPFNSWNSSHENGGCDNTAPRGGAGRIYCFASD